MKEDPTTLKSRIIQKEYVDFGKDAGTVAEVENIRAYARSLRMEDPELTKVVPKNVPALPSWKPEVAVFDARFGGAWL